MAVKQTALPIQFLVIGGGIAGLSCALALRRVGHSVCVLEKQSSLQDGLPGGCRMAPNLSKILFHWGLEEEVRSIAVKSEAINLILYESGELLGQHHWDDEMLKEARGEFVFAHHSDLRRMLYEVGISKGVEVRFGAEVMHVDPEQAKITLASGDVITGDVIVGADGEFGVSRKTVLEEEEGTDDLEELKMFSTTVSKNLIMRDPELAYLYNQEQTTMFSWFGHNQCALGFPVGGKSELALFVYGASPGHDCSWSDTGDLKSMQNILKSSESSLQKLGKLATPPRCISVTRRPVLEDWVVGRMVVIGQAAHPIPVGSVQGCAMSVEDGAVIAKLFSHLHTEDQIESFLYAFQDLREPRCATVYTNEQGIIYYMTMPPGELQEYRDTSMRQKRDAGLSPLHGSADAEETAEWVEMKEVFGYDAEDEADNWWVEWGLLREMAKGVDVSYGAPLQVNVS